MNMFDHVQNILASIEDSSDYLVGTESLTTGPRLPRGTQSVPIDKLTTDWKDPGASTSVATACPVYVDVAQDGKKIFTTYITGPIADLDNYITLIDTLFTANEGDIYYIFLDSPGGAISCGALIASAISVCKAEVITIARGLCASAAALIHAAAKRGNNKVSELGVLMLHMSSHDDYGVSTKILDNARNQVRYVNENLLKPAIELGYITNDELASIQNGAEIFITADEFKRRVTQVHIEPDTSVETEVSQEDTTDTTRDHSSDSSGDAELHFKPMNNKYHLYLSAKS